MESKKIEISWASLWRILFFALFVTILFLGRQVILGLFLAIVISSGLEVIVNFLEKRGMPRTLGVILIFLIALMILILFAYLIVPRIIVELNAIFSGLGNSALADLAPFLDFKSSKSFEGLLSGLSSKFFSGGISPLGLFSQALGGVSLAVAVMVSSFYLSLSKDGVERFLKVVLPADYEKSGLKIYEKSRRRIGFWFQTQILLSIVMGLLVWGLLLFLGVKHAFLLGVLTAIFEIVPFVGPIISGAAAVLIAISTSFSLAFYTLIIFLALHQFESHVLVPLLTRKVVGLHPVIVIISLLIGAQTIGLLGVLIAVPLAAIFEEVIDELSTKKRPAVEAV